MAEIMARSRYPHATIPNCNFASFVMEQLRRYGDRIALVCAKSKETYSFNQLIETSLRYAEGFRRQFQISSDMSIAYCSSNRIDFVPVMLASAILGVPFTASNPAMTVDELIDQFEPCHCQYVFINSETAEKMLSVKSHCPSLAKIITMDQRIDGFSHLSDYLADAVLSQYPLPNVEEADHRDSVLMLLGSSGTSGKPKMVMVTHYSFVAQLAIQCKRFLNGPADDFFAPTENDVIMSSFPHFHIAGIFSMFWPLIHGSTCVIFSRYNASEFIWAVENYQISVTLVAPPILINLLKSPEVTAEKFASLKTIIVGAAPVSKELSENVSAKLQLDQIIQVYGMTELSTLCCATPKPNSSVQKHGSCGVLLPCTECKIIDRKTGKSLGPRLSGEILIRGPQIVKGYLNNLTATQELIDSDGWLHTGDIGYFDEDGYFFVVDRLKELIKVNGFQVAPAELEAFLLTHPAVANAAVIGIPDEYKGELPRAYVVLAEGYRASEQEIKDFIAKRVSSYKRLEGGVKFVDRLPQTSSGKTLRRLLRVQEAATAAVEQEPVERFRPILSKL